jgi:hypothetical protein
LTRHRSIDLLGAREHRTVSQNALRDRRALGGTKRRERDALRYFRNATTNVEIRQVEPPACS